jgi:hypothetical protein
MFNGMIVAIDQEIARAQGRPREPDGAAQKDYQPPAGAARHQRFTDMDWSGRKAQEPAATRLIVYSEEVDSILEWSKDLATVEATTLLIERTNDEALRTKFDLDRAGAIRRLKEGPFKDYVQLLAEQLSREAAPVVHGKSVTNGRQQKALELYGALATAQPTTALARTYGQTVMWLLSEGMPAPAQKSIRAQLEDAALQDFKDRQLAAHAQWQARVATKHLHPTQHAILPNGMEAKVIW